jgi:hypothetical protein
MFFKAMPRIGYKVDGKTVSTKDIFRRVGLDRKYNNRLALDSYYVRDGETPDIVANNVYGSSNYHWVILTVNNIVNPYEEWPRKEAELFDYTESKYGVGNALLDHHYRLTSNTDIIVDYDSTKIADGDIEAVSNYDFELDLNQSKRQIYLLKTDYLAGFVTNYKKLMAN